MSSGDDIYKQILQERARKLQQQQQQRPVVAVLPPPPLAMAPTAAVLKPAPAPVLASTLPRLSQPSVGAKESVFARLGQSRDVFAEPPLPEIPEERKRKPTKSSQKKPTPKRIFMDQYALEHPQLANDPQRLLQEVETAYKKLSEDEVLLLQDEADRLQKADLLALQMQQWQTPQPVVAPLPGKDLAPPAKKRRVAKSSKQPQPTEPQGDFESNLAAILGLSSSSSSSSSFQ